MKRLNITIIILATVGFAGFAVSAASADIYSWTDENGVRYFTNHAPPKQATLLMKTPEIAYDEEADLQRRESDALEMARQELAEREAYLLEQQQEAERRMAAANARAEAALREAEQVLQEAEAAQQDADYGRSYSRAGVYYPYFPYGYRSKYVYRNYYRSKGSLHFKRQHDKFGHRPNLHRKPLDGRHFALPDKKHVLTSPKPAFRNPGLSHDSRAALFRMRHGRF